MGGHDADRRVMAVPLPLEMVAMAGPVETDVTSTAKPTEPHE